MMKMDQNEEKISGLAALLLFAVFAVCVMLVLLTGAKIYERLVQRDQAVYDCRTAVNYLAAKIRQSDQVNWISEKDNEMLVITEEIEGMVYETRIYCHEGWLYELFTIGGGENLPEEGIMVLPAEKLWVSVENGFVCVVITDAKGNEQELKLSLRSGKEFGA